MGTTLTGTTPQDTYDSLIKVTDNGPIGATAKYLSDGLGNDSVLALSTSRIGIGTTSPSSSFKLTVNSGSNINSFLNGDKISFSRTSDNAFDVVYLSRTNDLGVNGTANVHGYDGIQFRTEGPESVKATITSAGNVGIGTTTSTYDSGKIGSTHRFLNVQAGAGLYAVGTLAGNQSGNGDRLGYLTFVNDNNSASYKYSAWLGSEVEGTTANQQGGRLIFATTADASAAGPIERMRITSTGVVDLAQGQIKFPATQVASADPNTLDDYEEGTFTATLAPSTSGTITLSVNTCTYTKIGRQVTVKGFLTISSVASPVGTSVDIGGLPFTIINSTSGRGTFSFVVLDASTGYNAFTGPTQHTANSTSIIAYYDASTLAASDEIMFTATYFV